MICAAAAAAVVLVFATRDRSGDTISVEVAYPVKDSVTEVSSVYGKIRPARMVTISPDVSGEIVKLCFAEGDTVRKGDLLLTIRQDDYLLAVRRAEASLGSATARKEAARVELGLRVEEAARADSLHARNAVSKADLQCAVLAREVAACNMDEAVCQEEMAVAALEEARTQLAKTMVYAPASGVVTRMSVEPGERVVGTNTMSGTEMMTISDLGEMELVVELSESDVCRVKRGNTVRVKVDAAPDTTLYGHVSKIASSAAGALSLSGITNFEARISIDSQDVIRLLPGMSAAAEIITGSKNDILTLPLQSVFVRDGVQAVWTVDRSSTVHLKKVRCGIQDFQRVEILSGPGSDEKVVCAPFSAVNSTLHEGAKVKISNDYEKRQNSDPGH